MPSYGSIGSSNNDSLGRDVKIMIAGLLRPLAVIPEEKRSFDQAVATLKQNSLMESQGDVESSRVDKLVNSEGAVN